MKKNRIILLLIIVCVAIVIATYLLIKKTSKKTNDIDEYVVGLTEKFTENKKVKIWVENVGYVDDYLILKYDVKAKDESSELFDDSMIIDGKFNFHLPRRILINGKTIETSPQYYDQISHRVSYNEAVLYDIINVGGEYIPENFEMEVRFYENDYTVYEEFYESEVDLDDDNEDEEKNVQETSEEDENEDEKLYDEEEEDVDLEEYVELNESRGIIENDGEAFLEEDATEEDYEEVVGEYFFEDKYDEKREKMLDDEESAVIGVIAFKATKAEMMNNCEENIIDGEYAIDNVNVESVMVVKTPFGNLLLMDTKISDVSGEVIYRNTVSDPYTYDVDVQDENGASVKMDKAQEVHIYYGRQNEGNTANIRTLILLDSGLDVFIIQPYYDCENAETIGDGFFVEV